MPVIARFYGIVIKMYFSQSEHNPPHFHAVYGEYNGVFLIENAEMLEGDLPNRAKSMIEDWAKLYKDDLIKIWNTQNFIHLPGLE